MSIILGRSNIIELDNVNNSDPSEYIKLIKKKYSLDQILQILKKACEQKILILGDPILDLYEYCYTVGTSSKSASIAMMYGSTEEYLGGSLAVSQMLINVGVKDVELINFIKEERISAIKNINKNIVKTNFYSDNIPIIKRIVDKPRFARMLQIYNIERINLSKNNERKIIDYLKKIKNKKTLCLVTDFGFGFMSKKIIDFLNISKINYSLNCHLNSININYNYYNRYKNFMYLTFNKKELVMNFKGDLTFKEKVKLARAVLKKPFAVTVGSRGSFIFDKKLESFFPAIYKDIIDPVGCGDAYFAITSILMKVTKDLDLINFLGNLYAGMHAMIICNKSFVSQSSFIKKLKVILS